MFCIGLRMLQMSFSLVWCMFQKGCHVKEFQKLMGIEDLDGQIGNEKGLLRRHTVKVDQISTWTNDKEIHVQALVGWMRTLWKFQKMVYLSIF